IPRPRAQTLLSNGPVNVADPPSITFSETPTQSLWITNIPPQATPGSLQTLFANFASLEAVIVDPARRCAYLTFPAVSQAVEAQAATNGTELYVGQGLCTVTFAQMKQQVNVTQTAPLSIAYVLQSLNASNSEISDGIAHMQRSSVMTFSAPILPLSETLPNQGERSYTPPVLRDIRRRLETMPQQEVEDIALDMMEELPHLASDYIVLAPAFAIPFFLLLVVAGGFLTMKLESLCWISAGVLAPQALQSLSIIPFLWIMKSVSGFLQLLQRTNLVMNPSSVS
ncbi:hypothetical protein FF38_12250, partial [Lucilia cuprina]